MPNFRELASTETKKEFGCIMCRNPEHKALHRGTTELFCQLLNAPTTQKQARLQTICLMSEYLVEVEMRSKTRSNFHQLT